jgi:hypothetical protein
VHQQRLHPLGRQFAVEQHPGQQGHPRRGRLDPVFGGDAEDDERLHRGPHGVLQR